MGNFSPQVGRGERARYRVYSKEEENFWIPSIVKEGTKKDQRE